MRKPIFALLFVAGLLGAIAVSGGDTADKPPLGLPPVPIPADNPQTPEKIALGEKLYNEERFSTTGDVGCLTCHDPEKAFTDSPLKTSEGIEKKSGTRNSPTVINSAYFSTQFWDGRSPDLEDQALHPFIKAERTLSEVDVEVLTDARTSELGRFAINREMDDPGSFRPPTLRNVAVPAPYMHDGSIETLEDVVVHYLNGGVTEAGDPVNDFLSGGIRPLNIEIEQIEDLVAFMEALTSPEFEIPADTADGE